MMPQTATLSLQENFEGSVTMNQDPELIFDYGEDENDELDGSSMHFDLSQFLEEQQDSDEDEQDYDEAFETDSLKLIGKRLSHISAKAVEEAGSCATSFDEDCEEITIPLGASTRDILTTAGKRNFKTMEHKYASHNLVTARKVPQDIIIASRPSDSNQSKKERVISTIDMALNLGLTV